MQSPDVIIAGAGIIGVSLALELRERGASVLVLDRREPGLEASSAAAGMLAAIDPATPVPLRPLALECARLYPQFVQKIENASGLKADFRRQGTIALGEERPAAASAGEHHSLSPAELRSTEPRLETGGLPASFIAEDSVDPALLMRAMVAAARIAGIELRSGITVQAMESSGKQVAVITDQGPFLAGAAVTCCGAWSGAPVKPLKGHMLYLKPHRSGLLEHVVRAPGAYIVPRTSGKILVGTTVEDVGFDRTVNPQTILRLHAAAAHYIPDLATATVTETWAGFRPGSPDDLPLMGETTTSRIFLASGHFRNGILLAPVTARIMADLITGRPPGFDINAFAPQRFTVATA